jgi:hypothetical protein
VQAAIASIHQIKTLQNQLFFLKMNQRPRLPQAPPPKTNKTKQNQKKKRETKTKSNGEIERREQIAQNPKLFHKKKRSNQIGEIERRKQINQSPKRFLEI